MSFACLYLYSTKLSSILQEKFPEFQIFLLHAPLDARRMLKVRGILGNFCGHDVAHPPTATHGVVVATDRVVGVIGWFGLTTARWTKARIAYIGNGFNCFVPLYPETALQVEFAPFVDNSKAFISRRV